MAICATPIKGTHLRIVKLDTCGAPVTGSSSLVVVTKGFVQVGMEPQYEDGEEFFERTADGSLCVNQKDEPILKRVELTIEFCEIDPIAAAYIASMRLLDVIEPPVTGTGFAMSEGAPVNRYSLEVWQKVAGAGACAPSGVQRFIYNAWPNVGNTQVGEYTVENDRSSLEVTSESAAAASQWGNGPGTGTSWLPTGETAETDEHWLWNITTNPPPTAQCGATTLS